MALLGTDTVSTDEQPYMCAAVYLRESTQEQRYSRRNQIDLISSYAIARRMRIVRIYQDIGRSGVTLNGRKEFQRLIWEVLAGHANYSVLLVYDISRWGRFQNIDESAHLEFVCRQHGISIEYCAEEFSNGQSLISSVLKGLKRTLAAEHSRELSVKSS
jgi:DNA invertase Pin-like site-specific DNA recombinase